MSFHGFRFSSNTKIPVNNNIEYEVELKPLYTKIHINYTAHAIIKWTKISDSLNLVDNDYGCEFTNETLNKKEHKETIEQFQKLFTNNT